MFSDELLQVGKRIIPGFIGVFPADELPNFNHEPETPYRFIVNTQSSNLPGEHWIAVSCEDHGIALIFDPLGFYYPPTLINFLSKKYPKIYFNKIQYQHPETRLCGQLCIEFLKSLKNLTISEKVSLMA